MEFKANSEVARYTKSGEGYEVSGDREAVLGQIMLNVRESDVHLAPMAVDILRDQMDSLQVGEKRMFNWACSVLNVVVERTA